MLGFQTRPLPTAVAVAFACLAITLVACGSGSANPSPAAGGTSASDPRTDDSTVTGAVGLRADDVVSSFVDGTHVLEPADT